MWRTRVDRRMQNICHFFFVCCSFSPFEGWQHMCLYTSAATKAQHDELEHDECSRCIRKMLAGKVSGPLENVDLQRILIVRARLWRSTPYHLCGCEWQAAIVDPYSLGRLNVL
ncbi:hypothetical protein BDV37DRAFT_239263 [Aspergillus pseudonomiae]|uniref:Uncharacterized protein n=1 Tax=Aspergillus pseudonomiae TaxID=1506151 RepID=A0A5N7DP68_9EURO|nr:uncharacterized protein BDV37DRAFT_239263 [Aspergillus pseudonomiae]KAE8408267.1 hypothetical protein BDV37DRAFT_239263 [Aspergillus pseudonomiae]